MDGNGIMDLKTTTAFFYGCALLLGLAAPTQRPAQQLPKPERFLFVVDTSASMKRLDAANRQALFDLIYHGLNGRMLAGDSYGIWTFDDNLYAGEFPMQTWNPEKNLELASRAATFLKSRRYKGESRFEPVVDKLMSVIRAVKDVNILIISGGDTPLAGTAVDETVNASYTARADEGRRAKKPFVTTLVARDASIVNGLVTIAGEAIALPERPAPLRIAKAGASTSRPAGSNSTRTNTAATSASASAASVPPAVPPKRGPSVIIIKKSTNRGPEDISSMVPPNEAKPTTSGDSLSNVPPVVLQPEARPIAQAKPSEELALTQNAEVNQVALPPTSFERTPANDREAVASSELVPPPVARLTPVSSLLANAIPVAAREPSASTNLAPTKPSALTAVAVTPGPILQPRTMVIIGAGLFIAALSVLILTVKHYRTVPQSSFISRSMDQH